MSDIAVTDEASIRTVRMNRPDKKNALTLAMYTAMAEAVEDASRNPSVRCLMIAGAPGAFCAGNDIVDFIAMTKSGALGEPIIRFLYALVRCPKPVVAAVTGNAVGIGATMCLHCDQVIAGTDARFATPFVALGLVPEFASSLVAPRLMGHARAFSLLVMGQPLGAEEARAAGIVNAVVAPDAADAEALKTARTIAALPAEAVVAARRLMRGSVEEIIRRIDEEADEFKVRLKSAEAQAAFAAFVNRKK
ncbi:MAG: crotonase/enoyl-CoA hydratase family protein [Pseudolabrys sp.]